MFFWLITIWNILTTEKKDSVEKCLIEIAVCILIYNIGINYL